MKSIRSIGILAIALLLFSCDDDKKEEVSSPEDAKASVEKMAVDMEADLVEMVNLEGVDALTNLLDLVSEDDPFSGRINTEMASKEVIAQRVKRLNSVFVPTSTGITNEDGNFDFEASLGVYEYNFTTQLFDQTKQGGDKVTMHFPTATSNTNNATLNITAYSEIVIEEENKYGWDETSIFLTLITADLSIDNVEVLDLDMSANYSADGLPESVEVSLTMNPFEFTMSFSDTDEKMSSVSFGVNKSSEKIAGASVTLTYESSSKEVFSSVNGEVSYRDIGFKGDIDISDLENGANEPFDLNDLINLSMYDGSTKIGDVVFEDSDYETVAYIEYSDGSKELLEELLAPVIDELEDFILELEGE